MARTLFLVSPTMRGMDVRYTQGVLADSVFGNYKPGPIDGEYGEQTAGAAHRAKYWLGYPISEVNDEKWGWACGDKLRNYLAGKEDLPATYKLRRKRRIAAAGSKPLRERMLAKAKTQLGVKESPPGSNIVKYSVWYDLIGAWCAMFVTWCAVQAGNKKTFVRGSRYAYTPFMVRDARLGINGMSLLTTDQVKSGHIVMYDWEGSGRQGNAFFTDHTGLFDSWIEKGQTFKTVEGNTSSSNNSDGGAVEARTRSIGSVIAFIQAE